MKFFHVLVKLKKAKNEGGDSKSREKGRTLTRTELISYYQK